jgi:hypothetical protein
MLKEIPNKQFEIDGKYVAWQLFVSNMHCKESIPKIRNKYFPEKELRGHNPHFHFHVSVSNLYIPTIDLPILLQEIGAQILGIYTKSLTDS